MLIGTNDDDCIDGLAGKDKLEGRDGNDELDGGPGKDKLKGGNGDDIIEGGDGDDSAKGGDGDDTISGGPGKDKLKGDDGNDTLFGGPGRDKLDGKKGNDILDGGDDDDSAKGGDGDDTIFGGGGNDKLKGDKGNDFLDGGPGEDDLKAGDGDDFLAGGPGDDELDGGKDFDCAIFDGDLADFVFDDGDSDSALFATDTVGPGGTDRLKNIECFEFDDQTVIPGPNDAPIDILLSNDEVDDGDPVGTLVGDFTVIDPDLVDGHVLTLVPGAGDTDNASFTIVGDMLLTNFVADFATQSSYSIRVQAEDLAGATFQKVFTITVNPPQQAFDDLATVTEDDPATAINVLGNDINMFPAPISAVTQPANGTVVITGGLPGTGLTYQPDPDYCNDGTPTDDFTYTLTPSLSVATVAVTVTCVNDAPTADPDTATTLEDTAVVITLTGSDPDGDPLTFVPGPDPAGGTLSGLTPTGPTSADLTYTPDPDFCNNGTPPDDFTFTVDDGSASSPPATVAVTVTCVNDAPTADADTATTLEDTAVVITLTGSDPDGDPLTFVPGPDPAGGTLSGLTPTGPTSADLTYTPDPDFCNNGAPPDDFTFTVSDGSLSSPPATVAVTVTCVNDAPTADADTATTLEDTAVVITLTGSDPDGDPLTFVPGPDPAGGTLSGLTPTGPTSADLTYTPDPDFCNNGTPPDDFTFTVDDGSASSPPATVAVTVTCVNDAPTADADTATTLEDTAVVITLTGSDPDGDPLTFVPGPDPAGGTLSGLTPTGPTSADLTYTPDPDFCNNGAPPDDFTFTVSDGSLSSAPATVAVTVTCVNDAPTADADTATTLEDTAVVITLTGSDPDGDPLTFVPGPDPAGGTLSGLTPTGPTSADLTYTPDPDFCNNGTPPDDFTFTVSDGSLSSAPATVAVTVTCVNDAPTADADTATTLEDTAVVITLTGSDPDGDPLTFVPGPDPAGGTLSGLTPTGPTSADLTYTPDPDVCNDGTPTDDFTFTVFDGSASSPPATVAVTVTCVNDPPTAAAGPYTARSNIQIDVPAASGLLALSADDPSEGTALTVDGPAVKATTAGGTVTITLADGAFTYDPPPGYVGPDDFSFTVTDSGIPLPGETSAPATVSITVSGPVVWFIDDSAAPGGDGTLDKPFDCIVGGGCFDPVAADAAGDSIFVAEGTGLGYANTGALALLASQQLIGEGASTALPTLVPGLTPLPPFSLTLPSTGGTPPTLTSTADIIDVATGNTIRGVDLADNGGFAIDGSGFGTLAVGGTSPSDVTIDAATTGGGGVRLSTGTPAVLLAGLTSAFGASGIDLASVGGTFEVEGATTITDSTGAGIEVDASSVAVTLGLTTITDAGGNGIDLEDLTGSFTLTSPGGGITFPTGTNDSHGVLVDNSDNVTIQGTVTDCDPFGTTTTCFVISDAGNGGGTSSLTTDLEGFQGVLSIDSGDLTVRYVDMSGIGGQSSFGGVEHGIFVFDPDAGATISITDNDIGPIKNDGVEIQHNNLTGLLTVDISRNDIDGTGVTGGVETTDFGIDLDVNDGPSTGRLVATVDDNEVDDVNSIGISLVLSGDTGRGGGGLENRIEMSRNTIRDQDFDGISIILLENSRNIIKLEDMVVDGTDTPLGLVDPDRGIVVDMVVLDVTLGVDNDFNTTETDLTISGSSTRIVDHGDEAILVRNFGDDGSTFTNAGMLKMLIEDAVTVTGNVDQGLRVEAGLDGNIDLRVVGPAADFSGNDVGAGTPEDILVGVRSIGLRTINSYLAGFDTTAGHQIRIESDNIVDPTHQFGCGAGTCGGLEGTATTSTTDIAAILNNNGVTASGGAVAAIDIDLSLSGGDIDVVDETAIPTAAP